MWAPGFHGRNPPPIVTPVPPTKGGLSQCPYHTPWSESQFPADTMQANEPVSAVTLQTVCYIEAAMRF